MTPEKTEILHVTPHLGGGVGRVLLNYIGVALAKGQRHSLMCLDYANPWAKSKALENNITLRDNMFWKRKELREAVKKADILAVHWWNHPLLYSWLASENLPETRALVWSHVSGFHSPQIITREILFWPDVFAVSNPISFNAPAVAELSHAEKERRLRLIFSSGGLSHVENYAVKEHSDFRVGYLGTVDYAKMHPGFLEMSLASAGEDTVFAVAGGPSHEALRREAEELGAGDKFEILGPIENVGEFLSTLDVFGYPLIREHYGTGEQVLIEAMAVGVPPVVLGRGSEELVVENGVTGLVAEDPEDYALCVRRLKDDPELRSTLSRTAREKARKRFAIENTVTAFDSVYAELMERPKKRRSLKGKGVSSGMDRVFLLSQGPDAARVYQKLEKAELSGSPSPDVGVLTSISWAETKGSVYHYASFFPENSRLKKLSELMTAVNPLKGGRYSN
ncbi:MAG: glycosyltransferase family 4 protein [Deltaproteobacteria bacterium]|jgi:glycosyltransferase involved in cell wall biosynthesis|nr:glycosyltransferase family 4 protein [Deltaproteobacteria bacterium]